MSLYDTESLLPIELATVYRPKEQSLPNHVETDMVVELYSSDEYERKPLSWPCILAISLTCLAIVAIIGVTAYMLTWKHES